MFTLKKYIGILKRSIPALLTITLLLGDFYVFGMQNKIPKYNLEQEDGEALRYGAEAPTQDEREEREVELPEIKIDIEALRRSQENPRQEMVVIDDQRRPRKTRSRPHMAREVRPLNSQQGHMPRNVRPKIETYQDEKRLTNPYFPLDCLELIFEFLVIDDWDEIVDLMSNHTDFYLTGLKFLSRLPVEREMKAKVPIGTLSSIMVHDSGYGYNYNPWRAFAKGDKIFTGKYLSRIKKIKKLIIARNYLRNLVKKIYFNDIRIKRKLYSRMERGKLNKLVASVNKKISEKLIFKFFYIFGGRVYIETETMNVKDCRNKIRAIEEKSRDIRNTALVPPDELSNCASDICCQDYCILHCGDVRNKKSRKCLYYGTIGAGFFGCLLCLTTVATTLTLVLTA